MVSLNDKVYVRSGDTIYLYGGDNGDTYDSSVVTMTLPYLTLDKPADRKALTGADLNWDGSWSLKILYDPQDSTKEKNIGQFDDVSYQEGVTPVEVNTTHFAPKLVSVGSGYHRLSDISIHFEGAEQKG